VTKRAVRIAALTVALLVLALPWAAVPRVHSRAAVWGRKIAIDPGHGGSDLGSTACPGLLEKKANLDIAEILRTMLVNSGATVYMTRDSDVDLSNKDRAAYINGTDAEVSVTLHLNGWDDPEMDGLYVLYGKTRKDKTLAEVMHDTMWDPLMTTSPDPGSFTDFGTRQFAAGVLLWSEIPSVLLESVFISNAQECALLKDGTGVRQQQIAQAVYDGLNAWFSQPPPPLPGKGK
jgi:N-acetylmuramoyl-L-alanine amidase